MDSSSGPLPRPSYRDLQLPSNPDSYGPPYRPLDIPPYSTSYPDSEVPAKVPAEVPVDRPIQEPFDQPSNLPLSLPPFSLNQRRSVRRVCNVTQSEPTNSGHPRETILLRYASTDSHRLTPTANLEPGLQPRISTTLCPALLRRLLQVLLGALREGLRSEVRAQSSNGTRCRQESSRGRRLGCGPAPGPISVVNRIGS